MTIIHLAWQFPEQDKCVYLRDENHISIISLLCSGPLCSRCNNYMNNATFVPTRKIRNLF